MSAGMDIEQRNWRGTETVEHGGNGRDLSAVQVECLIRNSDHRNLIASVRAVHAELEESSGTQPTESRRRAAIALQEQWNALFVERDQLRNEIRRGRECLEQLRGELAALRARLEEWPAFERICGSNPLPEYMQALASHERVEKFLPGWLERREHQLHVLGLKMENYAKQHGVEHLL